MGKAAASVCVAVLKDGGESIQFQVGSGGSFELNEAVSSAWETPVTDVDTWGEESNAVGAYGRLSSFLKYCKRKKVVNEYDYLDLCDALDDVAGRTQDVINNRFFRGNKDANHEIFTLAGGNLKDVVGRSRSLDDFEFKGKKSNASDQMKPEDVLLFQEPSFDSRVYGDISSDARNIACAIAHPFNLIERYHIPEECLVAWIESVAEQYNPEVMYHNWFHALDVFQFCYMSLAKGGAGTYFNFQDILVLLTSTVAHDAAHMGTNNAFLVNTQAALALYYNDKSPLENMHASLSFGLMRKASNDFLRNLPKHDSQVFREKYIDAILATDMTQHFETVDVFSSRMSKRDDNPFMENTKNNREKQQGSKADRRMLMRAFIHMSDLANCCRPWDIYKELVCTLEEEFFLQGDQERQLGLPIMPLMDREKDSLAASQFYWIDKFVGPLMEPFCCIMSEELAEIYQKYATVNRNNFQDLVSKYGKLTAAELRNLPLEDDTSELRPAGRG